MWVFWRVLLLVIGVLLVNLNLAPPHVAFVDYCRRDLRRGLIAWLTVLLLIVRYAMQGALGVTAPWRSSG